jgi:ribosome-associated protein
MDKSGNKIIDISNSAETARYIVSVLIEKKALDVKLFNVAKDSSVTDYYVNATGRSSTQVASLADEVVYKADLIGYKAHRVEGRGGNSWLLVDFGDVVVNIFDKPSREFYNFDRLLPQEANEDISDIIREVDEKFNIEQKD